MPLLREWAFHSHRGIISCWVKSRKGSSAEEGPLQRGRGPTAARASSRFCRHSSFKNAGTSLSTLLGLSSSEEHLVGAKPVWLVLILLPQCYVRHFMGWESWEGWFLSAACHLLPLCVSLWSGKCLGPACPTGGSLSPSRWWCP